MGNGLGFEVSCRNCLVGLLPQKDGVPSKLSMLVWRPADSRI